MTDTVLGQLGLGALSTIERPEDVRLGVALELAQHAPLLALSNALESEPLTDPIFHHIEETDELFRAFSVGAATAGATTLSLDDNATNPTGKAKLFKKNDILLVEATNEKVLVTADPTNDTQITVQRGFAGTTAATIPDDGALVYVGSAWGQGTRSSTAQFRKFTNQVNYAQIFKESAALDNTTLNTATRVGNLWRDAFRQALQRFSEGVERSFFKGTAFAGTDSDGNVLYTTGGLDHFVTTNVFNVAGNITEELFEEYLEDIFRYGNQTKVAFIGSSALRHLNQLIKNKMVINTEPGGTFYGLQFQRWLTPQGVLLVTRHPLLSRHPVWRKDIYIVDLPALRYRYLRNRDIHVRPNVQSNDMDGRKDEIIGEIGLQVITERRHGIIKDIRGVA